MSQLSDVFSISWKHTKPQLAILAGLLIGFTIISVILSLMLFPLQSSWLGTGIASLITGVIGMIFTLGYTKNAFQTLDETEPQISAYKVTPYKLINYFIASIIVGLLVFAGSCLFILPGFYIAIRLQFFVAFIVEEDTSAIDSITRSWEITKGNAMDLFILALKMIGLTIVGIIFFIIGIYIAIPVVYVMYCSSFRILNTTHNQSYIQE